LLAIAAPLTAGVVFVRKAELPPLKIVLVSSVSAACSSIASPLGPVERRHASHTNVVAPTADDRSDGNKPPNLIGS
jgi:hypothetical protein